MTQTDRAARVWLRLRELAREDGTDVTVQHACRACAEFVSAMSAGLSLTSGAVPAEPVFATDARSRALEELQFTLGEGPAIEALLQGTIVVVADVADTATATRWPSFAPGAIDLGVKSIIAVPIQAGAIKLGVLGCYRELSGPPSAEAQIDALICAEAAMALAVAELEGGGYALAEPLDLEFTEHRAQVHQAVGMVSVQLAIGMADALARLRAHAYASDRRLFDVAEDIVARRYRFGTTS
jgi:GAF domain-containing protein